MPDGFNPHTELERINTLHEAIKACRQRVPLVMAQMDAALADVTLPINERIKIWDMVWNRAYGKPRQHVFVSEATNNERRVQVYIPDNGRPNAPARVIDAEVPNA